MSDQDLGNWPTRAALLLATCQHPAAGDSDVRDHFAWIYQGRRCELRQWANDRWTVAVADVEGRGLADGLTAALHLARRAVHELWPQMPARLERRRVTESQSSVLRLGTVEAIAESVA